MLTILADALLRSTLQDRQKSKVQVWDARFDGRKGKPKDDFRFNPYRDLW